MIVVYRGKHCPVSKNYLASLQQIYYELDELGVEVIAVSGDGRERAESFVSPSKPSLHCTSQDTAVKSHSVGGQAQWCITMQLSNPHCGSCRLICCLACLSREHHTKCQMTKLEALTL